MSWDWVLTTGGQLLHFCFLRLTALEHDVLRKGILQRQAGSAVAGVVVPVLIVTGMAMKHPRE